MIPNSYTYNQERRQEALKALQLAKQQEAAKKKKLNKAK